MPVSLRLTTLGCIGALLVAGCSKDPAPTVDANARRPRAAKTGKVAPVGQVDLTGGEGLTKNEPEEAAPVGPSAFVVDAQGKAHVLDRAASRVQVYEERNNRWLLARTIPLPEGDYLDLDFDGSGYVLLDTTRQAISYIDGAGKETASVRLAGANIPELGTVRALRLRGDEVWVQLADYSLVNVAQAKVASTDRRVQKGLDSGTGKFLMPIVKRPADVRVGYLSAEGPGALATLSFDMPVASVSALEVGSDGLTYVAVVLEEDPKPGVEIPRTEHILVVLDNKGNEVVRGDLQVDDSGLGCNRPLRIGADGKLYQMRLTAKSVDFTRFER